MGLLSRRASVNEPMNQHTVGKPETEAPIMTGRKISFHLPFHQLTKLPTVPPFPPLLGPPTDWAVCHRDATNWN